MADRSIPLDGRVLQLLRRCRRRLVASKLTAALAEALVAGVLATVAFGTWASSAGFGGGGWALFFVLLGAGLAAYVAWRALRESSLRDVAILLDRRLGFHDRVSSSLAFVSCREPTPFMRAHLEETAGFLHARGDEVIPYPAVDRGRAVALFAALCLVALLPHGDRAALRALDRQERTRARLRAGRDLAAELHRLRREADLHGLKKLSHMVARAEEALDRHLELVGPEERLAPPPAAPADSTETSARSRDEQAKREAVESDGRGTVGQSPPGDVRLSSHPTYKPRGKFDSFPEEAYQEVFAELDSALVGHELSGVELQNLSEHLDDAAGKIANYGFAKDTEGVMAESQMGGRRGEEMMASGQLNSFEKALAPLQYKSFSEFLQRYAAHLGEKALGKARFEMSRENNTGGSMFNVSAPPPKDAEFALKGVGDKPGNTPILQATADQVAKVASQLAGRSKPGPGQQGGPGIHGQGTELGGRGAGMGGASRQGAAPAVLPRSEGGAYLTLKGKLGDGKRIVELITSRGRHNIAAGGSDGVTYRDVYVEYGQAAEAELNGEKVPLEMRDYIRDYFRSIRPAPAGRQDNTPP